MNKTILISGGSDGLGKALAEKLVRNNKVIILANNAEKTEKVAKELGTDFVVADVSNYQNIRSAVEEIIKRHKTIDCLINNAGLWIEGALENNDPEQIAKVMAVNATGSILLTHAVLPHMKENKKGRIINVISQAGLGAKAERSVYNASKWAMTGFTKSLAQELIPSNISVCGFYPGSMQTEFFEKAGSNKDLTKFMSLSEAVRALEFIVETPDDLTIPELGIKPAWY